MQGISVEFVDKMGSDISVSNSARVSFGKWKEEKVKQLSERV